MFGYIHVKVNVSVKVTSHVFWKLLRRSLSQNCSKSNTFNCEVLMVWATEKKWCR